MTSLTEILARARADLPLLRKRRVWLERSVADLPPAPSFRQSLEGDRVAVIAEIKRRSPSAGAIAPDLDPATHAGAYARAGASAISVLTNRPFFGGSLEDLESVAQKVAVPVLRKDFILDSVQLLEARAAGASAALLIVRALSSDLLQELVAFSYTCGLDPVVEIHDDTELALALDSGADIIGVNSRDLDTFSIDKPRAWAVLRSVPSSCLAIAESGMTEIADVEAAAIAGADAVLIGTALSSAAHPAELVRRLVLVERRGR